MAPPRGSKHAQQPVAAPPLPEEPAIATLKQRYPGREPQIEELADRLRSMLAASNPLFVTGSPSTGKTSIIRDLLAQLNLLHAYHSCHESTRTRSVLESILHQLQRRKRRREDGYVSAGRCDSVSQFYNALPAAVSRINKTAWIVIDHAQKMAGTDLLSAVTHTSSIANVGVILIANVPWDAGKFTHPSQNIPAPEIFHFPAYSPSHILRILATGPLPAGIETGSSLAQAYRQFLQAVVTPLSRASCNLLDVRVTVDRLWPQYSAPLREGRELQAPALLARIRGELQRAIGDLEIGGGAKTVAVSSTDGVASGPATAATVVITTDRRLSSQGLAFELPFISKFLLLAAYIASRNKHTTDRAIFDPGYSRKGRKNAQDIDRQTEAAEEAVLRGPHAFPLERLLHIFYCLYEQNGPEEEDEQRAGKRKESAGAAHEVQRAEVHMQLSTLVSLRLVSVSGGDVLEGASYRCNISDDMALALASNVRMRLGDYLKLA